jgi:DNA-binding response OmpR family regulator
VTDPASVLVVDDEQDITTLMRDFLEAAGYRVLTAPDGQAALATLETSDVDCILLDIMMPGLSGFDVLRRIRETRDVPAPCSSSPRRMRTATRFVGSASAATTTS